MGTDTRRHYAFMVDRGPFTVYADGRLVHLRATLAYSARGYYKPIIGPTLSGGCGNGPPSERPRLDLELATPLTLTSDWHLASRVVLERIGPASREPRDRCDVTILHHDVTDHVIDAAREGLVSQLPDIDRKIADVDLGDQVHGWWAALSRPIRIGDGVWLELAPQRLAIGRVTGRGHTLDIPVTLQARPRIVTATHQPPPSGAPLPPLAHGARANGFHILVDGAIDYASASRAVDAALANTVISQGNRSITLTRVTVVPAAHGRLALAVTFTGDAHGTLRLVGTPVLDAARRAISMPDLDYDLESDNRLLNMYAWVRSDAMRSILRDKADVPVGPAIERGRALLIAGLNRRIGDALTLTARVDSVAVRGLYVTRAGIVVRAEARGRARVAVRSW
jgi:hypothetical protein